MAEYSSSDSEGEEVDETQSGELTLRENGKTNLIISYNHDSIRSIIEEEEAGEEEEEKVGEVSKQHVESPISDGKKKKRKRKKLSICLTSCKYDSVCRAAKRFGFREVGEEDEWNLYWTDCSVNMERVMDMKRYQKINHFPGMSELCRKDLLARNLNRMLKLFPKEYNIFPRSWNFPSDYSDFLAYTRVKKNKTYILKPESGCQGKGIWITKNINEIRPHEHRLCQQYLSHPFLIDGFKFDLRIYVLVSTCDPLRLFVFKEGLGRFATSKYVVPSNYNVGNLFMHLTNYAINKNSEDFIRDEESGSKRRLSTINEWFLNNGYDVDQLWSDIDDVIIKTLISAHCVLRHNYRTCFPNLVPGGSACFEILGFDIVLDRKLKPVVLEVNHSPSFTTDSPLDKEVKDILLFDTLNLVNFQAVDRKKCLSEDRKKIQQRLFQKSDKTAIKEDIDKVKWLEDIIKHEDTHMGNYRRIYPTPFTNKYDKFFNSSASLYQETATYKARTEIARLQREELNKKHDRKDGLAKKKKVPTATLR